METEGPLSEKQSLITVNLEEQALPRSVQRKTSLAQKMYRVFRFLIIAGLLIIFVHGFSPDSRGLDSSRRETLLTVEQRVEKILQETPLIGRMWRSICAWLLIC
jgi:predicted ferric reductase